MFDQEINPYAPSVLPTATVVYEAPQKKGDPWINPENVWRDGRLLVVRKGAQLPPRCVKCNVPADVWKKQHYMWHSSYVPILYLLFLQKAEMRIGLCRRHLAARNRAQITAWTIATAGIALLFASAALFGHARIEIPVWGVLLGSAAILGGGMYGVRTSRLLQPRRIDPIFAWLAGASPDYLAELPEVEMLGEPTLPSH